MCEVLSVSESGYYRSIKRQGKPKSRELLSIEIIKILNEHPDNENYGVDRVQHALEQRGIKVSRSTVHRVMREAGLLHKKRVPRGLTKATTEAQEAENLIKRDFTADTPYRKILTDITQVQCKDGVLYITVAFDCFSGEILALEMGYNMKKELCVNLVKQLKRLQGKNIDGAIMHSDRGSQYTSEAYREEVKKAGMIQSLSGTGKCYDNARMESFFATLKKEKLYKVPTYRLARTTVTSIIYRYIYGYYNRVRICSTNELWLPPVKYREWAKRKEKQAA